MSNTESGVRLRRRSAPALGFYKFALVGGLPDVKSALRIAKRIQRIRDPGVVKRLMALVDILAGTDGDEGDKGLVQIERPATSDETR